MNSLRVQTVRSQPANQRALAATTELAVQLAIYGGQRAVRAKRKEKWRSVRLRDLVPLLPYVVSDRNTLVRGGPISSFEERFARLTGSTYAILMNSGTATLHSAYSAVGVRPGSEVIVPTYTWFATVTPILQCGGTPVFCDIDPRTLTADPADVEGRITPRTRAICVVHVWGNPAAMDRFTEVARRYNVALIEDASHAHGATFQGKPVGSWGDIGCFSLQGVKAVTGGEAGVVVTDNPTYFDRMLALGHNGRSTTDQVTGALEVDNMHLGVKYRPHLCAAIMAGASLKRLPKLNDLRRRNYQLLAESLEGCPAVRPIETYPDAIRGGLLEFILRYHPEHAGGWPREAFVKAAQAEGVPINPDRYTLVGTSARMLHEAPLFNTLDRSQLGGCLYCDQPPDGRHIPRLAHAEQLADDLVTLPPFTRVKQEYVRQCAQALRKVAEAARRISDFRSGR